MNTQMRVHIRLRDGQVYNLWTREEDPLSLIVSFLENRAIELKYYYPETDYVGVFMCRKEDLLCTSVEWREK